RGGLAGLDPARTSARASYSLSFPAPDGSHDAIWRTFAPEAALEALYRRTGGRARVWAAQGWLTLTPGNVIDYDAIKAALLADAERYEILEVGFDRWGATQLASQLLDEGVPLIQVGQGFATMSAPTKELLRLVAAGRDRPRGSPLVPRHAREPGPPPDPAPDPD